MLAIFLLWLASIIAVSCVAIRENVGDKFRTKRRVLEQVFQSEIVIDGDTTTLERLLEDYDDESVIEEGRKTLHISVPSKSIDITVDKKQGELRVNADGRKVSVKASETGDEASVTIRRETDDADSAKTTRGSAARSREAKPEIIRVKIKRSRTYGRHPFWAARIFEIFEIFSYL